MAENSATTQNAAAARPRPRALGRGLESLLPAMPPAHAEPPPTPTAAAEAADAPLPATRFLAIALIDRNPFQTRRHINAEKLADLKRSIQAKGLIQPITVRPIADGRFQVIGGERRLLAVTQLGEETIQAHVMPQSDDEAFVTTIVENLQREDLDAIEQARAFGRLANDFHYHHDQIAARTGKTRSTVTNYLRLLRLPEELQQALAEGRISMGHAKALLGLENAEAMSAVGFRVLTSDLSVRKTEEAVQHILHGKPPAPPVVTRPMDPNVLHVQNILQRSLGLKVNIEDHKGRGRIIIEYNEIDDFEVLLNSFAPGARRG